MDTRNLWHEKAGARYIYYVLSLAWLLELIHPLPPSLSLTMTLHHDPNRYSHLKRNLTLTLTDRFYESRWQNMLMLPIVTTKGTYVLTVAGHP